MKIEELVDFLVLHGVGEYQVSVQAGNLCAVRPLTESQVIVDPDVILEMIAIRGARSVDFDL